MIMARMMMKAMKMRRRMMIMARVMMAAMRMRRIMMTKD